MVSAAHPAACGLVRFSSKLAGEGYQRGRNYQDKRLVYVVRHWRSTSLQVVHHDLAVPLQHERQRLRHELQRRRLRRGVVDPDVGSGDLLREAEDLVLQLLHPVDDFVDARRLGLH